MSKCSFRICISLQEMQNTVQVLIKIKALMQKMLNKTTHVDSVSSKNIAKKK